MYGQFQGLLLENAGNDELIFLDLDNNYLNNY